MHNSPVNLHVTATYFYVALPCTNPDWDGTVTERTRIYLVAALGVNISSVRVPSLPIC